ncbi:MAG: hypothetical protein ACK4ZJ_04660, partial [Allorhizobium sp.]
LDADSGADSDRKPETLKDIDQIHAAAHPFIPNLDYTNRSDRLDRSCRWERFAERCFASVEDLYNA